MTMTLRDAEAELERRRNEQAAADVNRLWDLESAARAGVICRRARTDRVGLPNGRTVSIPRMTYAAELMADTTVKA